MLLKAEPYISGEILRLKEKVRNFKYKIPTLAIISIGNDKASEIYIRNKKRMCEAIGIECNVFSFDTEVQEKIVCDLIDNLNTDDIINGIIVQLPLPKQLNERRILNAIDPVKDVDGLTNTQMGYLRTNDERKLAPCTPQGIMDLLKYYNVPLESKRVAIVNRSEIVGRPLAELFLQENAIPTICHSKINELDLREILLDSNIVVTGVGKPEFFYWYNFRYGSTIVDVSMNKDVVGKMCGDVSKGSYDELIKMGCNITPVPGGIGRTTVLSLMKNIIKAYEIQQEG